MTRHPSVTPRDFSCDLHYINITVGRFAHWGFTKPHFTPKGFKTFDRNLASSLNLLIYVLQLCVNPQVRLKIMVLVDRNVGGNSKNEFKDILYF